MATSNLHTFIGLFRRDANINVDSSLPLSDIEIPIIQRDYAQGRTSPEVNRIRKRFLTSLFEALTGSDPIKLDFIYGDIKNKTLIPLDGQQRLTTLFLLHWYIAKHEYVAFEQYSFLSHFSYRTRASARSFCKNLVAYNPDFSASKLSTDIIDQNWMPLDWKNDPTINAMLNMIDDIHLMFSKTTDLWNKLEEGRISFYFLAIDDLGMTDDLYIKMNSRGKPLTDFEHFKAEWEGYMNQLDSAAADRIARKIDVDWTDILWKYKGVDNIIDDEFVRYFQYLSSLIFFSRYPDEQKPTDIFDLIKVLFSTKKDDVKSNLEFIESSFDCLKGLDIKQCFQQFLTNEEHEKGKSHIDEQLDVFEDCCTNFGEQRSTRVRSFSIGRMILLYAFILFFKNRDSLSDTLFAKRLRCINNLISASEFELREDRMNELLKQTEEVILDGQIIIKEGRKSFNALQVQEEYDKQQWLLLHPEKEEQLNILEDHPLLYGGITVIGLENIDYSDRFFSLFKCDWSLVNRALLTIGDYSLKVGWRYQIGSAKIKETWRTLFHTNKDNILKIKDILVALLATNESFSNDSLLAIIDKYLLEPAFDWRHYLVKYDSMRPERYGMYYWYDYDNRGKQSYMILMMLTEKSIGGRNFNIFLKTLYDRLQVLASDKNIRLGEYAYQKDGDVLELTYCGKNLHYSDTECIITDSENNDIISSRAIRQDENGIDLEDRVAVGLEMISLL